MGWLPWDSATGHGTGVDIGLGAMKLSIDCDLPLQFAESEKLKLLCGLHGQVATPSKPLREVATPGGMEGTSSEASNRSSRCDLRPSLTVIES